MDTSAEATALSSALNEELSPLEQDVLDEYERLAENMKKVRCTPISLYVGIRTNCYLQFLS
jgi:hypothetical protein